MNGRPDILRHNSMNHLSQGNILTMNTPHLFPQQQQQQQPSQLGQQQQQPAPPPHMGLLQPGPASNPSLGLLPTGQPSGASNQAAVYQLQMQQANHQRRQQQMHQAMSAQAMGGQNASGPQHVNGISHNQLQNMSFPNGMMAQPSIRRVPSQPLGQSAGSHMAGMHTNQPVVGGMAPMGGMSMNPQTGLASQQLRHAQPQQMRIQQQPPLPMQGPSHMSPDFLNRQTHLQGNVGMQSNMARTAPQAQQVLGGLSQTSAISHPGIMQPSMQTPSFPNSISMSHSQPPPQMGSSPRAPNAQGNIPSNLSPAHTGAPSHPAVNRTRMTPDNGMFFQNAQMPHSIPHNPSRLPSGNGQFHYVPSSTPPGQLNDLSHSMSAGSPSNPGPANRMLMATPAQALEQMSQSGPDHFPFTHPISAPPRPPSQHATNSHFPMPHSQSQQHPQRTQTPGQSHQSSPQPTSSLLHMGQRPQSQPQVAQSQSPQAGPTRTPHTAQASLPGGSGNAGPGSRSTTLSGHTPSGTSPSSMQTPPTPTQSAQVPNRPLTGVPAPTAAAATPPSASQTSDNSLLQTVVQAGPSIAPQRMLGNMTYPVGFGQGLTRLLQFSGVLASDTPNKLQLSYWDSLIKEYFTPKASLKFTLWKDNQRNEAKPFEIGVPILPRFFLVTSQSGVKSMNLSLDGARERIVSHGHAVVECVHAVWTYRYTNGYTVTLRGPMTAHIFVLPNHTSTGQAPHQHVSYTLKFDQLQFDANYHDKLIAMEAISGSRTTESPRLKAPSTPVMNGIRRPEDEDRRFEEPRLVIEKAVIPAEPVNAFGIPQATMRCLELAESVAQMSPLIQFSTENKLGPLDALTQYARKLRDIQGPGINGAPGAHGFSPSSSSAFENGGTGVPATPPVTLYPGTPMSSGSQTLSSANIPTPSGPSASDTVSKQNKASSSMPQPPATPTAGPANASTPVSAPTPTAVTTTPSLTHSTLKRKAQGQAGEGSASANTTPEVPPPKRVNRKRGRTGG